MILRTSLIGKSGKFLAATPQNGDINQQLLTSGLISAILEFSKSINQQEIQSITFQDHTTSFLDLNDFFLIIDLADNTENQTKEKLLKKIHENAQNLLKNRSEKEMSLGEGYLILEEILNQTNQFLRETTKRKSFFEPKIGTFLIRQQKTGFEVVNVKNSKDFANTIAPFIDWGLRRVQNIAPAEEILTAYLPHRKKGLAYYLVINKEKNSSQIRTLKVPYGKNSSLFKQKKVLDKQLRTTLEKKPKKTLTKVLRELNPRENNQRNNGFDPEYFSLNFLEKNVKNIERVIFPLVTDEPVVVIGERPAVKIITNTLLLFTQHLQAEVIDWLTTGEEIAQNITGLSEEKYKTLRKKRLLPTSLTVVNLEERKVIGKNSSPYFKRLYTKLKKVSPVVTYGVIGNELKKLTQEAITLCELPLIEQQKALQEYQQLFENNRESKFEEIKNLACSRNPFLDAWLENLKSKKPN